jgi:hypothetical protein
MTKILKISNRVCIDQTPLPNKPYTSKMCPSILKVLAKRFMVISTTYFVTINYLELESVSINNQSLWSTYITLLFKCYMLWFLVFTPTLRRLTSIDKNFN